MARWGAPQVFVLYEVETLATLTSRPYLDRLNDPSPWTRRSLANFRNANRTLCQVTASFGRGVGGWLLTIRLSPEPGQAAALEAALTARVLPELARAPGLVGAHLLQGDPAASATETAEKRLRDRPDAVADWVVVIEGYDAGALEALGDGSLSPDRLVERGAASRQQRGLYRVIHSLGGADVADRG